MAVDWLNPGEDAAWAHLQTWASLGPHSRLMAAAGPASRQVVVLPFPFSDLSTTKLRPALVLVDAGRDDWLMCQVTSQPFAMRAMHGFAKRSSA